MALFGKKSGDESATGTVPQSNTSQPSAKAENSNGSHRGDKTARSSRGAHQGEMTVANIGKSIAIKGDLTGNEDMVIEGSVEGTIDLPNNQLTIGADGTIRAEIHAKSVIVVGQVIGNIIGIERVEIQGSGRVQGNVTSPKLVVAEGAQLDGAIQMTGTGGAIANPDRSASATVESDEVRKTG